MCPGGSSCARHRAVSPSACSSVGKTRASSYTTCSNADAPARPDRTRTQSTRSRGWIAEVAGDLGRRLAHERVGVAQGVDIRAAICGWPSSSAHRSPPGGRRVGCPMCASSGSKARSSPSGPSAPQIGARSWVSACESESINAGTAARSPRRPRATADARRVSIPPPLNWAISTSRMGLPNRTSVSMTSCGTEDRPSNLARSAPADDSGAR